MFIENLMSGYPFAVKYIGMSAGGSHSKIANSSQLSNYDKQLLPILAVSTMSTYETLASCKNKVPFIFDTPIITSVYPAKEILANLVYNSLYAISNATFANCIEFDSFYMIINADNPKKLYNKFIKLAISESYILRKDAENIDRVYDNYSFPTVIFSMDNDNILYQYEGSNIDNYSLTEAGLEYECDHSSRYLVVSIFGYGLYTNITPNIMTKTINYMANFIDINEIFIVCNKSRYNRIIDLYDRPHYLSPTLGQSRFPQDSVNDYVPSYEII
jgi:hypothetical protein